MKYRLLKEAALRELNEDLDWDWEPNPDSYVDTYPTMFPESEGAPRLGRKELNSLIAQYNDGREKGIGSGEVLSHAAGHFDVEWQKFQKDLAILCKRFWKRTGWIKGYDIPTMMNRALINQAKRWERPQKD